MFFDTDAREPSFRPRALVRTQVLRRQRRLHLLRRAGRPAFEYRIRGNIAGAAYTSFAVDGGGIDERYPPARDRLVDPRRHVRRGCRRQLRDHRQRRRAAAQLAATGARRGVDLHPPLLRAGRPGRGRPARAHPAGHQGDRLRSRRAPPRERRSHGTFAGSTRSSACLTLGTGRRPGAPPPDGAPRPTGSTRRRSGSRAATARSTS